MAAAVALITNDSDGAVRMWAQRSSGELECVREHKGNGATVWHSACVARDGSLAATSHGGQSRVWSLATGECVATLGGYECFALGIAMSSEHVAVALWEEKTIRLYRHDGTPVRTLEGQTGPVYDVSFSPDGQQLVSGSDDDSARVWNVATGTVRFTLQHPMSVYGVAWSPRGDRIATACADKNGRVWDAASGRLVITLSGHTSFVSSVAYSPGGARIATGSRVHYFNRGSGLILFWFVWHGVLVCLSLFGIHQYLENNGIQRRILHKPPDPVDVILP